MSNTAQVDSDVAAPATASVIAKVEPMTTARALRGPFDYRLPAALSGDVEVGSMLVVPFGPREVLGVVVGLADSSEIAEE
ncbi:MAG: primosomal protein, partial [Solirubrobacterales bacterium]|nr:primosomal protein [Solirubrobacterales bacterium]